MKIFVYKEFDQKSGNEKWPRLSFVQYLETDASQQCQMLQNARFTAFTVSELLRGKRTGGKKYPHPRNSD